MITNLGCPLTKTVLLYHKEWGKKQCSIEYILLSKNFPKNPVMKIKSKCGVKAIFQYEASPLVRVLINPQL